VPENIYGAERLQDGTFPKGENGKPVREAMEDLEYVKQIIGLIGIAVPIFRHA
jgi:hypothetical protein